mmetsp:Transcript_13242/g.22255  ORF Transcript_13242/g.22255 Transcript_13242/m.22255 type:complete len:91 (+) Transcript_13242:375-647(+)
MVVLSSTYTSPVLVCAITPTITLVLDLKGLQLSPLKFFEPSNVRSKVIFSSTFIVYRIGTHEFILVETIDVKFEGEFRYIGHVYVAVVAA